MLPNFGYVRPTSLDDALKQLASPGATLHAGGTDLLGCLRDGVCSAHKLVSLTGLSDLRGIAPVSGGGLRIGALAKLTEVAEHPLIRQQFTALAQAARSAASPQLRNQGTLGGNLCQRPRCWYFRGDFPCFRKGGEKCYAPDGENEFHAILGADGCYMVHPSDTAPALLALEASVRIAGSQGTRTVPISAFFVRPADDITRETVVAPNEILTEILLPPSENLRSTYRKVRVRGSWDFALAGVALALKTKQDRVEHARIALGGVAPIPWAAVAVEKALVGQRLDHETITRAAAAAAEGAQPLSLNAYKVDLVRGLVEQTLLELI
jgi:xanthine dehydrogenase YagS FAD-binding subunit